MGCSVRKCNKNFALLIYVAILLLLYLFSISCSDNTKLPEIEIEPVSGDFLTNSRTGNNSGLKLLDVQIEKVYTIAIVNKLDQNGPVSSDTPFLRISIRIQNYLEGRPWVHLWATSFNSKGDEVSKIGPLMGKPNHYLEFFAEEEFSLQLDYSKNIRRIEINASTNSSPAP